MSRLPPLAAALILFAGAQAARAADLDEMRARGVLRHLRVPYVNFVSGAGAGTEAELTQELREVPRSPLREGMGQGLAVARSVVVDNTEDR